MSLFQRMKRLWIGFWSSLIGQAESSQQGVLHHGLIQQQKSQLQKLRDALTHLIFQRKRTQQRIDELVESERGFKKDLEQAAMENRDDLAIQLMGEIEKVASEAVFLNDQLKKIEHDIEQGKESEKQLLKVIEETSHQLATLSSRRQALMIQKDLKNQLNNASSKINSQTGVLTEIRHQIQKLEAENEVLSSDNKPWEKELTNMRKDRRRQEKLHALEELKRRLKGDYSTVAPARKEIIVVN